MYSNDNALRKKKRVVTRKNKIIQLKRLQDRKRKKDRFIFSFFAFSSFSLISGGLFCFVMGQAKLNELTYKISKSVEEKKEEKIDIKNLEFNQNDNLKVKSCATENKAIIYQDE